MNSMISAKIGTASTNAANSRCSWASTQIATRLPTPGKRAVRRPRRTASPAPPSPAPPPRPRAPARAASALGRVASAAAARYSSRRTMRTIATRRRAASATSTAGRPRSAASRLMASLSAARFGALPLELADVGDDRPTVRRRDRPPVGRHQARAVRDHVEQLAVGVRVAPCRCGTTSSARCRAGTGSPCRRRARRGTAGSRSRSARAPRARSAAST